MKCWPLDAISQKPNSHRLSGQYRRALSDFFWRRNDCSRLPDSQGYQVPAQCGKNSRHADYPGYPIHRDWRGENWYAGFPSYYGHRCSYQSAGIEKSRTIETSRISTTTLKLIELASIVEKLMRKNKPGHSWSRGAHSFYALLAENYSEGLLDDLLLVRLLHFLLYDTSVDWLASLFRAGRGRGRAKDPRQNGQQNCLSRSPPSESSLSIASQKYDSGKSRWS